MKMLSFPPSVPAGNRQALLFALLALPLALGTAPRAAVGGDGPVRVTTDSNAYCAELALRLAAQPQGRIEPVRSMAEEGERLCETGHVRTGIAKLRRALRAAQAGG